MNLRNWRSFHGENALAFSTDPTKPVTLILGPNGAGKTALLNAFTWVIYGEFTEGFDRRQDLINHEALSLDPNEIAEVRLVLTDAGKEYTITRRVTAVQQAIGANDVFVSADGKTEREEAIHQLLPRALKDLFFFPAETFGTAKVLRSESKQAQAASLEIDGAIRTLLAGDVYDNAIKDLRDAVNSSSLKNTKKVSDESVNVANQNGSAISYPPSSPRLPLRRSERRRSLNSTIRSRSQRGRRDSRTGPTPSPPRKLRPNERIPSTFCLPGRHTPTSCRRLLALPSDVSTQRKRVA